LYPLEHRLVARLLLEADRHGPGFEHVLQRSKVLGVGGDRQRLGDLLDEPLLVGRTHLAKELKGVDGQLEVVAVDPRDHAHACLPALVQRLMTVVCRTYDQVSSFMPVIGCCPCAAR
jgi:hypothetical protein